MKAHTRTNGLRLLKLLPSLRLPEIGLRFNDLSYLLQLVYTNRKRVKFLRLAFDTMIATEDNDDTSTSLEETEKFYKDEFFY